MTRKFVEDMMTCLNRDVSIVLFALSFYTYLNTSRYRPRHHSSWSSKQMSNHCIHSMYPDVRIYTDLIQPCMNHQRNVWKPRSSCRSSDPPCNLNPHNADSQIHMKVSIYWHHVQEWIVPCILPCMMRVHNLDQNGRKCFKVTDENNRLTSGMELVPSIQWVPIADELDLTLGGNDERCSIGQTRASV